MSKPILPVIQQAMCAHDGNAAHWLKEIIALQQHPESALHHRALATARSYLEELLSPPAPDTPDAKSSH